MATIWDKIYREYLGTDKKYATIGGDLHPLFFSFIKKHRFPRKSALDIGCGEGRYLKYLKDGGFKVSGIDSSTKAVQVTKKLLKQKRQIFVADMYRCSIPADKYDLVISVAAIHHGHKSQIRLLVHKIYRALVPGGLTFITFSDSKILPRRHKPIKEIEPGTFVPLEGPEKGLLHSGFTKTETRKMFSKFRQIKIIKDHKARWLVMAKK